MASVAPSQHLNVVAMALDGQGNGAIIDDPAQAWQNTENRLIWLNLNCDPDESQDYQWLYDKSGLDDSVLDSLTAQETRPRFYTYDGGLLVIMRALDLNPEADPEEMLSVRLWIEASRIITIQRKPVAAIDSIKKDLQSGHGPLSSGDFLVMLADYISLNMSDFMNNLDDDIDDLEDKILQNDAPELRQELSSVRRRIIHLRRYLAPQREVLMNLQALKLPFISDDNRFDLREVGDRLTRYVEMLDSGRERANVAHDELDSHMKAQSNRTIFVLSVVTVIFLPLNFLTSLLGINVGGIPGSGNKYAFALVCGITILIGILEYLLFRKKKML